MRYAIIADIHGSVDALDAILDEVSKDGSIKGILVLGDLVGGGPDESEVIQRLQGLENAVCISGNTDRWITQGLTLSIFGEVTDENVQTILRISRICGRAEALLTESGQIDWLKSLPYQYEVALPNGKKLLAVHGSPASDEKGFTEKQTQSEQEKLLLDCSADVLIAGHTHTEYHNRVGQTEIHVIPSASIPVGEDKSAFFAILDTTDEGIELSVKKVAYDHKPLLDRLQRKNHPGLQTWIKRFS